MVKEYETSHTASESAGTNATDINNLGNAPFDTEADRIWITYVGFDEVCFSTSYFPGHSSAGNLEIGESHSSIPGVDISKPFFVRVNKTVWQPTRINTTTDPDYSNSNDVRWSGEIFGLAPLSNYECEFVSTADCSVIFSTSVRTLQAPMAELASISQLSPSVQRSLRPGSPTSTLKASIATAETKLAEERNRLKRERKEQKSKLNALRKEIDKLTSNIASAGGNDDRLRQKAQQSNLHMKQAEDAVLSITAELEALEELPEDDSAAWKSAKQNWQSQKDIHKSARNDFIALKQSLDREVQTLTNEVSTLQQKRERMQSRLNKLNGEHERITDANAKGLDEAQRKATERSATMAERARTEMMYMERLDTIGPQINEMQTTLHSLWNSIQALQYSAAQQAQVQQSPTTSLPPAYSYDIPEGTITNTSSPWNPPAYPNAYVGGTTMTAQSSQQGHRTRGRSSSMLSNVSGFTQSSSEEQLPLPRETKDLIDGDRQRSDGSSSAGTSSSDPKSPVAKDSGLVRLASPWNDS